VQIKRGQFLGFKRKLRSNDQGLQVQRKELTWAKGRNCLRNYNECWSLYSLSNSAACSKFDSGSHMLSAVG
jgi:hypothetical protein